MHPIPFFTAAHHWEGKQQIKDRAYICGFCSQKVSSDRGYIVADANKNQAGGIYICSHCLGPTFFTLQGEQIPAPAIGSAVSNVPEKLTALYEEARKCANTACYTGAVLLCRKMLMNIAVEQGAHEGLKFIEYVDFLSDKGYVPPKGKHWVDHIRKKGNEATHEIALMNQTDARELLTFLEMLLRFIYEFPAMIPDPAKQLVQPKKPIV